MNMTSLTGRPLRATLAALTIAAVAIPTTAEAGRRTRTAVGVGLAAGVAGLAIGSAVARDREDRYYDDRYERRGYYARRPVVYEERRYVRPRRCWTERRTFEDSYGDVYTKRVQVCR